MKLEKVIIALGIVLTSTVWSGSIPGDITTIPRYIAWCAFVMVLVVLVLLKKDPDFSIIRRNIFAALGIYIAISMVSIIKATNFSEWFSNVSAIVLLAFSVLLIGLLLKDIREIALPMSLMVIVLGTWGIWQYHSGNQVFTHSLATMGNRNIWAQWMLLLIPFCLAAKNKWIGLTGTAIALYNIFIANTRAAMVAFLAALFITAVIFNRRMLIAGVVLIVLVSIGIYYHQPTFKRITDSESMCSRLAKWRQTLIMVRDNFMVGAGNWKISIIPYSAGLYEEDMGTKWFFREAHNEYIEITSEKSIFGLVAYLSIFGFGLFYARKDPYVMFGLVAYLVYIFFDNKQQAPVLIIVAIFLAVNCTSKLAPLNIKRFMPVCYLVLAVVMYGYIARYGMLVRLKKVLPIRTASPDVIIEQLSHIPKVATLSDGIAPYAWFRGDAYLAVGQKKEALRDFFQAYKENPNYYCVLLSLAKMFYYGGYEDQAIALNEKVLVIAPGHQMAVDNLNNIRRKP